LPRFSYFGEDGELVLRIFKVASIFGLLEVLFFFVVCTFVALWLGSNLREGEVT